MRGNSEQGAAVVKKGRWGYNGEDTGRQNKFGDKAVLWRFPAFCRRPRRCINFFVPEVFPCSMSNSATQV